MTEKKDKIGNSGKNFMIAKEFEKECNYSEAIHFYKKSFHQNSIASDSCIGIGNCYFRLQLYCEAIQWYKKALKSEKNNKYALNGLANAYEAIGKWQQAIKHFQKAMEVDKNFSYPCNGLGNFYFKKDEYHIAAKWYEKAYKLNPNSFQIGLNLSRCLVRQQNYIPALTQLQKLSKIFKQKHGELEQKLVWIAEEFLQSYKKLNRIDQLKIKQEFFSQQYETNQQHYNFEKNIRDLINCKHSQLVSE